jgi:Peptidase family M48
VSKLILWVPLGVLYVIVAVGIVHFEGDAHRRGLRDRRQQIALALAAKEKENEPETPEPKTVVSPPIVAERPTPPPTPDARSDVITPPEPIPLPEPKKPSSEPAREKAKPAPAPRKKAHVPPAAPKAHPVAAEKKEPAVKLPTDVIPNLVDLPTADELRIGKLLHMLILANHGDEPGSPFARRVAESAQPLIDIRSRKDIPITITIVDSNDVAAFSHLGGFIYLTRGLFTLAATDPEYQFLVGRELAHIDLKHGQQAVAEAMKAGPQPGVGTLQYLYHQIALGNTEERENEADDWAVDRMSKLDRSERDCLAFLRKLQPYSTDPEHDFRNGAGKPKTTLTDPVQDLANSVPSLPAPWKRLQRLKDRLKRP